MPYIGKQLVRGQNRKLDDISSGFNGSQTTFTLQVASQNVTVGSALQLWISLGGVIQEPTIDYTIAGNQITFTTAPAASLDFFGVIQGDVTDTNTPGDATVTTSKLATGLTVNLADGSAATSSLQLGGTDSGLFSSAADKVNVTTGGVERLEIGDSEVVFNDPSNDVDFRVESNGNANMLFVDAGNDRVGIGASGPKEVIDARGAAVFSGDHATSQNAYGTAHGIMLSSTSNLASIKAVSNGSNDVAIRFIPLSSGSGSEAMRIDSSGRLLVGASASAGSARLVQIAATSSEAGLSATRYINDAGGAAAIDLAKSRNGSIGSQTIVQSGDALGYLQFRGSDGTNQINAANIRVDVDGTPGTNDMPGRMVFSTTNDGSSSPTERMRIDNNGRVGIGAASAAQVLQVHKAASAASYVHITNSVSGSNSSDGMLVGLNASAAALVWNQENTEMRFATNNTERMRIASGGDVGIGTSSPSALLNVDIGGDQTWAQIDKSRAANEPMLQLIHSAGNRDAKIRFANADSSWSVGIDGTEGLVFNSGETTTGGSGTERMRLDASGRLLLGIASVIDSNSSFEAYKASGQNHVRVQSNLLANGEYSMFRARGIANTNTREAYIGVYKHSGITNAVGFMFQSAEDGSNIFFWTDNSGNFRTSGSAAHLGTTSGTVVGTQTSDLRLKNVGANVGYGLAEVKQLQPKQYALKKDPDVNKLGFIAQEVESIIPEAVFDTNEELDGHQEGDRTKLGMEYVQLIPVLVNAIKELSAEVDTLKTKVAALEAE